MSNRVFYTHSQPEQLYQGEEEEERDEAETKQNKDRHIKTTPYNLTLIKHFAQKIYTTPQGRWNLQQSSSMHNGKREYWYLYEKKVKTPSPAVAPLP